jgi:hypothetical protein
MTTAEYYFAPPEPSFWRWQDGGSVVTWTDGHTIAFRQELVTVYKRLQTQSLPPFGAVLLVLAACRDSWNESIHRLGLIDGLIQGGQQQDRLELLISASEELARIYAIEGPLRTRPEAKAEIAAMIFEGQGESPLPGVFAAIIGELEAGLSESTLTPARPSSGLTEIVRDLAWLRRGAGRVSVESLTLRLDTGLDQSLMPAPVKLDLPAAGDARKLVLDLMDDPELGGVARLAKLLLAAVHLPTPMSCPEELPVGGVSDISNRGSIDRLLVSELANDGLTLAVRVAMNEALYLRRESPPRPPARRRLVLIDAGIRMWGVPRVFATAVGLAFAAGADDAVDVQLFRSAGGAIKTIDYANAAGLTEHLSELDHRVHPGNALAALAAEATSKETAADVIVVTGQDVVRDQAFQKTLAALPLLEVYLAVVSRDGQFELWLETARGKKVIGKAAFALDDVLFPPKKPTAPLLLEHHPDLPAIFHAPHFPLRMSCHIDVERSWHVIDFGTLTYCRDGRLLHWNEPSRGAVQLAEGLPEGNLHAAISRRGQAGGLAIVGKLTRRGLHLVTFDSEDGVGRHVPLEITIERPLYAFFHQDVAFVGDARTLNACHVPTGKLLAERSLEGHRHHRSRFYTFPIGTIGYAAWSWRAATCDGSRIEFVEFYKDIAAGERVNTAFDSVCHEGPMVLTSAKRLIHCGERKQHTIPLKVNESSLFGIHSVSRNGRRLLLSQKGSSRLQVYDIATGKYGPEELEAEVIASMKTLTLRHRFLGIGIDARGRLGLIGKRDSFWPLSVETALGLTAQPSTEAVRLQQSFERMATDAIRYDLSIARFTDGSSAVLDSRGLLHLRSSDASLPEITLVLVQGQGAGWISTGVTWGSSFFHDGPTVNTRPHPVEVVHEFGKRLR